MEIIQNFTPDDIDKIEHMIFLRYKTSSKPVKNRGFYFKLLCILTPILYWYAVEIFEIGNILVFIFCITIAVISTIYILWYLIIGAKLEKEKHELLQERLGRKHSIYIDKEKILHNDIEYPYEDVRYVIYLEPYVFIFVKEPKYLLIKVNKYEKEYIKGLISNYPKIIQEEKKKFFNIYVYLKKSKDKPK